MPPLDPAWIALFGTLFGGVGLKAAEKFLGRNKVKIDDATTIRGELRSDNIALKEENKALDIQIDKWRDEYYKLRDEYVALQTELTLALNKLRDKGIID